MRIADRINERFDQAKPWELAKDPSRRAELQDVCTDALNAFRVLTYYLAPVLPALADKVARMLDMPRPCGGTTSSTSRRRSVRTST